MMDLITLARRMRKRLTIAVFFGFILSVGVISYVSAAVNRPDDQEGPIRVYTAIYVLDVDEINNASQSFDANVYYEARWRDSRLSHGNKHKISRPLAEVWHPRLQLINQQKLWKTFPEIVAISPEGDVNYRQRVWGSFSQPLDLADFPFDRQTFTIQLAAADYGPDEVELLKDPDSLSGIAARLSVADWDITGWKVGPQPYETRPGEEATVGFNLSFEGKRRIGYFVTKVIIPLVLIVAMSWCVFWIDPKDSGSQISVAITAMLTLIAFRFAAGAALPAISYLTRLDYFILASTFLVYASLVEVIITTNYAKNGKLALARAIDRWARWLFPSTFVLLAIETLILSIGPQ